MARLLKKDKFHLDGPSSYSNIWTQNLLDLYFSCKIMSSMFYNKDKKHLVAFLMFGTRGKFLKIAS